MAGIYLHIPFCKRACYYCNFHFSTSLRSKNDVTGALLKEIELRRDYLQGATVETVYFGGGTPSLLEPETIAALINTLSEVYPVIAGAEITLEANPDDINGTNLAAWKAAGINRLSVGIQSFFEEDLVWMNRAHNALQAKRCIADAQAAGITNISIDLIYGVPGMTDERWISNIETALSFQVPHLSCYALTVEPGTALDRMIGLHTKTDVDQDRQATQFLTLIRMLEAAGYEHYEISSFALPGCRSRHNQSYWQSQKYLGLGPSAHSFDGLSRQWNVSNNIQYASALEKGELLFERELLQEKDRLNEYIMTALRTREGISLDHINTIFGAAAGARLAQLAAPYILRQHLIHAEARLYLTMEGKLFADGIAAGLFELG